MADMKAQVKAEISDMADRLMAGIEDGKPAIAAILEDAAGDTITEAADRWPHKTGRSLAGLFQKTAVEGDTLTVTVSDKQDYTYMIKAINLNGRNPFRELIIKRGKAKGKVIGKALGEAIARGLNG